MTKQEPWFVEERARWFASLVLTNHKDVKVKPYAGTDMPINLLVEVLEDGSSTLRLFGVQVVGCTDLPDAQEADELVISHVGRRPVESNLPICAFVINVRKPEGIYRWVVEPVADDGRSVLQRPGKANWQPLDEAGVAHLIAQVHAWYDARNGASPARSPGQQMQAETG
jgi:hypothetical protein